MVTKRLVLLMMTAGALACATATPYQRKGASGGYAEVPLDGQTFVVSFEGNSSTEPERVLSYLHYRCAEVTLEAGYTHFLVLHVKAGKDTSSVVTNVSGGPMFPSAVSQTMEKPYAGVVIKLFKSVPPPGAFDAAGVLRTLGPKIGQPDHWQPGRVASAR
jgi:hypothetical protein